VNCNNSIHWYQSEVEVFIFTSLIYKGRNSIFPKMILSHSLFYLLKQFRIPYLYLNCPFPFLDFIAVVFHLILLLVQNFNYEFRFYHFVPNMYFKFRPLSLNLSFIDSKALHEILYPKSSGWGVIWCAMVDLIMWMDNFYSSTKKLFWYIQLER
jgi:hypothetical protein